MHLYGYWRSGASYRVRIALNFKGLSFTQTTKDLRTGAQTAAAYRAINPQGFVPALENDGRVITQSPAIIEWLEERYPTPALLPRDADLRAVVRAMAALVACDVHPLNNLRVLNVLKAGFGASQVEVDAWAERWIGDGFAALEQLIGLHGGACAFGDAPTMADCFLVPQVYSAERFAVDLAPFPRVKAAAEHCRALPAFAAAHPDRQPDAG